VQFLRRRRDVETVLGDRGQITQLMQLHSRAFEGVPPSGYRLSDLPVTAL
jgi:hypothetical protein